MNSSVFLIKKVSGKYGKQYMNIKKPYQFIEVLF